MSDCETLAGNFFRLFLRLHRLLDKRLAEQGASLSRTKMLLYVSKHGPARAADIADFFGFAPRTVTEAIDGLERDGLVLRTPDAHDRRVKQVTVTDEGQRVIKATEPLRRGLIDGVFGGLDAGEREQFDRLLLKMMNAVEGEESR